MMVLLACAGTASAQITLSVNPTTLSFASEPGGSTQAKTLAVSATSSVDFTATTTTVTGSGWLSVEPGSGKTATLVFVVVTPGSLSAGNYSGYVTITAPGATNSPLQVPVTLSVGATTSVQLAATPPSLSFAYTVGGQTPQPQNLLVSSTTTTQVTFTASATTSSGGNWLTISASGGTTPTNLTVGVSPSGLAPATYNGTITLTPTATIAGSLQVQVTLTVAGTPQLSASPSSVTFYYQIGTTAPAQQTVSLSSGGVPVSFVTAAETTSGGSWLVVFPNVGATPSDLAVGVNSAVLSILSAGIYQGKITVTAPQASNSPFVIPVTLWVSTNPFLTVTPNTLSFDMTPGGALPASKNLSVGSTGGALPFSVTTATSTPAGVNWLSVNVPGGFTPATVAVNINSAAQALPPGTYTGTVTFTVTAVTAPQVSIPITLTVSGMPALTLSPTTLVFNYQIGKALPGYQTVEVKSTGVPVSFTVAVTPVTGGNWLQLLSTTGTTPATVYLYANPSGLSTGTYESNLTFTPSTGGAAQTIKATLNVSNTPLMNVSPTSLAFDFVLGSSRTSDYKPVALTSTGDPLNFTVTYTTASGGSGWLAVAPTSGTTSANITVFVYAASLPLGTYTGSVTVAATNANTQVIPVTVTVTSGVNLSVTPTSLTFSQSLGGAAPPAQKLSITTAGTSVRFTATPTTTIVGNWLTVTPLDGSTPAELSVTVSAAGLAVGTYAGTITIVSPGATNSPVNIPVSFTVSAAQTIAVSTTTLQFSYQTGGTVPAAQKVTVSSSGGAVSFTAAVATGIGTGWLTVSPGSGSTPAELAVGVSPAALAPGSYTGTITVSAPSASNSPQQVSVTLTVTAAPQPQPVVTKVVNAASYVPGSLTVGEIVYLEGTNIGPPTMTMLRVTGGRVDTILGDTRILFDGIPAPLIYVSSVKSSAVVPYALFGRASTRIQVEYQNQRSSPLDFRLADAAPGLFSLDASGQGQGAILNQDYSVNNPNNPAPRGSVVMLYGTGEGQLRPPVADGSVTPTTLPLPAPVLPVTVIIGGRPAQVFYAGPAPGFVAGVLQVNVRVPEDAPAGIAVPVVIIAGAYSSQPGLTMAVR